MATIAGIPNIEDYASISPENELYDEYFGMEGVLQPDTEAYRVIYGEDILVPWEYIEGMPKREPEVSDTRPSPESTDSSREAMVEWLMANT